MLVYSDDFNSYVDHLRKIFQIVREKRYQCQSKKLKVISKTDQSLMSYNHWWKVDTSNIKVVTDFVTNEPSNIGQQRTVFRLLGYYRRFVKIFSRIAQPVFDLLEKDNIKGSSKAISKSIRNVNNSNNFTTFVIIFRLWSIVCTSCWCSN